MRIIAIANQKGGVGKTTTTVNLGAALAAAGKKVILMDLDPQAHLTTYLGIAAEEMEHSSYELLSQSVDLAGSLRSVRENLHLLPANLNLAAAEQELVSVLGREVILRDAIEAYPEPCDYILIDCPPSLGLLTLNALCAAKELFIPLQPHFLSLQGLSQLLETVLLVHQRINPELRLSGLLFCMYDSRTSLSGEIVGDIQSFFAKQSQMDNPWKDVRLFETRIRGNIKLAESPSYGQTILEYAPGCHGAEDYRALAGEVEGMYGESKFEPEAEIESTSEPSEAETQPEITAAEKAALTEPTELDERPATIRVAPARVVEETAPAESTVEQAKEVPTEGI
jgi:chromosome partitioning protein